MDVDTGSVAVDSEHAVGNPVHRTLLARYPTENVDDHLLDVDWPSHWDLAVRSDAFDAAS